MVGYGGTDRYSAIPPSFLYCSRFTHVIQPGPSPSFDARIKTSPVLRQMAGSDYKQMRNEFSMASSRLGLIPCVIVPVLSHSSCNNYFKPSKAPYIILIINAKANTLSQ